MKTVLIFMFSFAVASLTGQTATISHSDLDNDSVVWMDQGKNQNDLNQRSSAQNLAQQIKICFQDQQKSILRFVGNDSSTTRQVETESETWTIRDNQKFGLYVSDNSHSPSSEKYNLLHLDIDSKTIETIEVYDVLGRIVHSSFFDLLENLVPMDHLTDGIYYLVLRDPNKEPLYSQKLALN